VAGREEWFRGGRRRRSIVVVVLLLLLILFRIEIKKEEAEEGTRA